MGSNLPPPHMTAEASLALSIRQICQVSTAWEPPALTYAIACRNNNFGCVLTALIAVTKQRWLLNHQWGKFVSDDWLKELV